VYEELPVHLVIQEGPEFAVPVAQMVEPVQLETEEPPVHLVLLGRLDLSVVLAVLERLAFQDLLDQADNREQQEALASQDRSEKRADLAHPVTVDLPALRAGLEQQEVPGFKE